MSSGRSPTIRPLKGANIGFGNVAEWAHQPAFAGRSEFALVAVAEPLPERRLQARALLPRARLYDGLEALLQGEPALDFVDICTPPRRHVPLTLAALKRGCHVLCEKPLALAPDEFREIEVTLAQTPAALVTVHNWKYAPLLALATAWLRAGTIGTLRHFSWEVYRTPASGGGLTQWRQDPAAAAGGILVDHGWHAFYLALAWAGAPRALKARLVKGPDSPTEVEAEVELQFPGATGRLFFTWRASERGNRGRLTGSAGEIRLEDDALIRLAGASVMESRAFPEKLSAGSHHPRWMAGVLAEFLEEIHDPERRGRNFQEAQTCASLIRLAYGSHEAQGAWLPLPSP